MITIGWTDQALAQATRFQDFKGDWDMALYKTSKDLADYAQQYFTPFLHSVRSSPSGNGDTARSVKSNITHTETGFEINYTGLISAYYMDVGNFDPGYVMTAASKGLKAFPVDRRFGTPTFSGAIHGMGYRTPGVPSHWSEETVKHMGTEGVAIEMAMKHMVEFLNEVVITE